MHARGGFEQDGERHLRPVGMAEAGVRDAQHPVIGVHRPVVGMLAPADIAQQTTGETEPPLRLGLRCEQRRQPFRELVAADREAARALSGHLAGADQRILAAQRRGQQLQHLPLPYTVSGKRHGLRLRRQLLADRGANSLGVPSAHRRLAYQR